jgi:hypothetical protein
MTCDMRDAFERHIPRLRSFLHKILEKVCICFDCRRDEQYRFYTLFYADLT